MRGLLLLLPVGCVLWSTSSWAAVTLSEAGLSEAALTQIADDVASQLKASPLATNPPQRVAVGAIVNAASVHVDLEALGDRLTVALIQAGKFDVVDVQHRQLIAKEYAYQKSDYVDPQRAHDKGEQAPVDVMVTGVLKNAGISGDARAQVHSYRLSLIATDVKTGVARFAYDTALERHFVETGISSATATKLRVVGYSAAALTAVAGAGAVVFSLAHIRNEERDFVSERVTQQASGPEPVSGLLGVGLLLTAPVLAVLTFVVVPDGNPNLE